MTEPSLSPADNFIEDHFTFMYLRCASTPDRPDKVVELAKNAIKDALQNRKSRGLSKKDLKICLARMNKIIHSHDPVALINSVMNEHAKQEGLNHVC